MKSKTKKHLALAVVAGNAVKVVAQTHRGEDFADGNDFVASNGFRISSYAGPSSMDGPGIYVRGWMLDTDFTVIPLTSCAHDSGLTQEEFLAQLRVAVKEYNAKYLTPDRKTKSPTKRLGTREVIE